MPDLRSSFLKSYQPRELNFSSCPRKASRSTRKRSRVGPFAVSRLPPDHPSVLSTLLSSVGDIPRDSRFFLLPRLLWAFRKMAIEANLTRPMMCRKTSTNSKNLKKSLLVSPVLDPACFPAYPARCNANYLDSTETKGIGESPSSWSHPVRLDFESVLMVARRLVRLSSTTIRERRPRRPQR